MLKKFGFLFFGVVVAVALVRGIPTNMSEWGPWAETQIQDLSTFVNEQIEKINPEEIIQVDILNPENLNNGSTSGETEETGQE